MSHFLPDTLNIFFPQWQGSGRIDPKEFTHVACPTPGGIHIDKLRELLITLEKNFDVVGFSVLEFLPAKPGESASLEVINLLDSADLSILPTV